MDKRVENRGHPNYFHMRICNFCEKEITNKQWHPETRKYYARHVCSDQCYLSYVDKKLSKIEKETGLSRDKLIRVFNDMYSDSEGIWVLNDVGVEGFKDSDYGHLLGPDY